LIALVENIAKNSCPVDGSSPSIEAAKKLGGL